MDQLETCPGCGLSLKRVEGPADPYSGASPSCWAAFGEVLARDFPEAPSPEHRRSAVDAYMAQHPGYGSAAGRRSVIVHLVGLSLSCEDDLPVEQIVPLLGQVFPAKDDVEPLLPIPPLGAVTIASVQRANGATEHAQAVDDWARAVWTAWAPHHERIRALVELRLRRLLGPRRPASPPESSAPPR